MDSWVETKDKRPGGCVGGEAIMAWRVLDMILRASSTSINISLRDAPREA